MPQSSTRHAPSATSVSCAGGRCCSPALPLPVLPLCLGVRRPQAGERHRLQPRVSGALRSPPLPLFDLPAAGRDTQNKVATATAGGISLLVGMMGGADGASDSSRQAAASALRCGRAVLASVWCCGAELALQCWVGIRRGSPCIRPDASLLTIDGSAPLLTDATPATSPCPAAILHATASRRRSRWLQRARCTCWQTSCPLTAAPAVHAGKLQPGRSATWPAAPTCGHS